MKPSQERRLWTAVERSIEDLLEVQAGLLEVLARDDQEVEPPPVGGRPAPDPTHRRVTGIATTVERIEREARLACNGVRLVLSVAAADGRPVRQMADCLACGGSVQQRPRSGYCPACYKAWCRAGRPDRLGFEKSRREGAAS